jgi:NodT family efflux transporter outer membrane factor (OMF) lipoprotein
MFRLPQFQPHFSPLAAATAVCLLVVGLSGCTSLNDYVHNGFKVGPNYCRPAAPVANNWIDAGKIRVSDDPTTICHWWTVLRDPKLDELIACAYRQNLTVREAGYRVLQARANLAIARGDLFPQSQNATGSYTRSEASLNPPVGGGGGGISRFSSQWNLGFNLQWELDFWGALRRAIASADASLNASVEGYDAVLVTLFGDIASNYVRVRTDQERIRLLRFNVDNYQMAVWERAMIRSGRDPKTGAARPGGGVITESDADVAESTLKQSLAAITQLISDQRQAENQLCILMGMPPVDLSKMLDGGPIPRAPVELAIGIPADLVRRRPDVRQAERVAAAQAEQIGIAQAALYPAIFVNGSFGYTAQSLPQLFTNEAFRGAVGPSFQWNVLNYGRIVNSVRFQDAKFLELVATYQQTVLQAASEVENGLIAFLQSQERAKSLFEAMQAQAKAVGIARARYLQGGVGGEASFSTYTLYEQNLLNVQDAAAQAQGDIAQALIAVYRALGGGWEIRLGGQPVPAPAPGAPNNLEPLPAPLPAPPPPVPPPATLPQPPAVPQPPPVPQQSAIPQPPAVPLESSDLREERISRLGSAPVSEPAATALQFREPLTPPSNQ